MSKSHEMDMTTGNLFPKILKFAIPLMFTGILQLLFNAADLIVVGQFAENAENSVSAIGSTSSLLNLIINVFMGISVGANVLMAKAFGSRDPEKADRTLHTSILLSLICGAFVGLFGFLFSYQFLIWMGTPASVIDLASIYLKIYFIGTPFNMLYNFGAALLRSLGDTKRPLYYLSIAGVVNVLLNLLLVIVFKLDVAGVAIATITSEAVSAVLVFLALLKGNSFCKFRFSHCRIYKEETLELIKIGIPAGIQGSVFSISNVLIQSSVNSFGEVVLAGNTAASNIEGFIYAAMNAIYSASLAFTAQNVGARNFNNIRKTFIDSLILVTIVGASLSALAILFAKPLLGIYINTEEAIQYGITRMSYIVIPYFLCGIMDVATGTLRGLGFSISPTIITLFGACIFRIVWIYTAFAAHHELWVLYISYPISWALTSLIQFGYYFFVRKDIKFKLAA